MEIHLIDLVEEVYSVNIGWADEEEKKKTVTKNKPDFHNVESYFKKPEKAVEQPKSYQSHWEAENQRKIQSSTLSRFIILI
jgi:hypothetical protein